MLLEFYLTWLIWYFPKI